MGGRRHKMRKGPRRRQAGAWRLARSGGRTFFLQLGLFYLSLCPCPTLPISSPLGSIAHPDLTSARTAQHRCPQKPRALADPFPPSHQLYGLSCPHFSNFQPPRWRSWECRSVSGGAMAPPGPAAFISGGPEDPSIIQLTARSPRIFA